MGGAASWLREREVRQEKAREWKGHRKLFVEVKKKDGNAGGR